MNLGQLELVSTSLGWQVRLCSRALLASSTTDVNTSDLQRLITAGKSGLGNTSGLWVSRGRSLDLQLDLNLEDRIDVDDGDIVTEAFSAGLMNAKFWAPLKLLPISTKVSTNNHKCLQIVLSLAAVECLPSRKLHKLHHDVSIHDIQPPPGVRPVLLESVHLDIHVAQYTFKKRRKNADQELFRALASDKRKFDGYNSPGLSDMSPTGHTLELDYKVGARPMTRCYLKKLRMHNSCSGSLINAGRGVEDDDMLFFGGAGNLAQNQAQSVDQSTPTLSVLTANTYSGRYHDEEKERLHGRRTMFLNLLDALLRHTITSKPRGIAKCVRMSRKESFTPLEHLSPATCLPGHLEAMASRSAFLPTIGHAIASIGSSSATDPALKLKLSELARRETAWKFSDAAESNIGQTTDLQELICARLWRSMDRQLSKRNAANSLKSLHQDDPGCYFTRSSSQNLDDNYSTENLHSHQMSEESGDTDLLDHDDMFIDGMNSKQGDCISDDVDVSSSMKFDDKKYYESTGNIEKDAIDSMFGHETIRHLSCAQAVLGDDDDNDDDDNNDLLFDDLYTQDGDTSTKNIMAETLFDSEHNFDLLSERGYDLRI